MIPLKYAYLSGCLLFFIPWALLYWRRQDLRKVMLVMGLIGAVGSVFTAYYWTADWWRPQTVTGTRIGLEDFILGLSNGGIAAVLYLEVFHRRLYKTKRVGDYAKALLVLTFLSYLLFWISYNFLDLSSFYSFLISIVSYCAALLYLRRDLLISCLLNGTLMLVVALPIYYSSKILSPGAITSIYVYPLHPAIRIFDVPIQEFVFYFAFGFMMPLMYDYWHGLSLRRMRINKPISRRTARA